MEEVKCFICKDTIRPKQQRLKCRECDLTVHRTCTKMNQVRYRELVRDNHVNLMKCDVCESSGEIHILEHYQDYVDGGGSVCTSAEGQSVLSILAEGQNMVSTLAAGQSVVSTSATGQSVDTTSAAGQSVVSTSAAGQSVVSTSAAGQSVVSISAAGQSVVSTSAAGQSVVSTSAAGQSVVSTSAARQSVVSTSAAGQSVVSTSAAGQTVVSTSAARQSVVSTSAAGQSVVSTSAAGQSVVSTSVAGQSVVSTSAAGQSVVSTSAAGQSVVSTFAGRQSMVSTSTRGQSVVSTSAGGQSSISVSTGGQSSVSASTGGQSRESSYTGGQSIMSLGGQSIVASSTGGPSMVSATRGQSMVSISTGSGQSMLSTLAGGQSMISTSIGGQSMVSTSTRGQSMVSTATQGQSVVSTSAQGQSMVSTSSGGRNLVSMSAGQSVDVRTGKQTPFSKKIEDIFTATIVGKASFSFEEFYFHLTKSQADKIRNSRDSTGQYKTGVQLRFWQVNGKGEEQFLPLALGGFHVFVNYQMLDYPSIVCQVDAKKTEKLEPIDITSSVNLNLTRNRLKISHSTRDKFHVACELVQKRTIDDLVDLITVSQPQHTEDMIKEKFKGDDDCEIATTNIKASLICPIGRMRLVKPCRSRHCTHIQCIDAKTILSMCRNKPSWKCQVCREPAEWEDLYIDGLFSEILKTVPWNIVEVEFLSDGSWTHKKAASPNKDAADIDKENTCVLLNETIDKLDVIDLTETDEEGTPVRKTPLKTNSSLMNKINTVKNLFDKVANHIEKVTSSNERNIEEHTSSYGCHRNNRNHYRQPRPYERHNKSNNTYNGGHSSYRSNNGHGSNRNNNGHGSNRSNGRHSSYRNNGEPSSYRSNSYLTGTYGQTAIDRYWWRNNNDVTGSDTGYQHNSSSNSYVPRFFQPIWR